MKPLRVLVIVKNRPAAMERGLRPMGMWSYPVAEFTWDFLHPGKTFALSTAAYQGKYDLIFHEDGGAWGEFIGDALPVVYHVIDSTLSEKHHYLPRLEQARQADLVLVDHDRLSRFRGDAPVERLSYAINDVVFQDYRQPRTVDIAFHCGGKDDSRAAVRGWLSDYAAQRRMVFTSGVLGLREYALAMNRAKVTVNIPRTEVNRPHRVFDALACRTCLVTKELPLVEQEFLPAQTHVRFSDAATLQEKLDFLFHNPIFRAETADYGYQIVMRHHTWRVRAKQLREMLDGYFHFNQ